MIGSIPIKKEWIDEATAYSQNMGKLNNSITDGEGNVAGFIGEIIVSLIISGTRCNTYDYDLIKDGKFIDVKTKRCTSFPLDEYECSIAAYNTKQKCSHYVFTRILNPEYSMCWVLGYMEKDEYFKTARFCKAGDVDKKSGHGWKFKADCYNLEIGKLKDVRELRADWQKI
jgi:hypothetical protein